MMILSWQKAVNEEYRALIKNGTRELKKRNLDGSVARNKARLVAQGFSQIAGSNYHETFSSVVKANIVRMVLAVVIYQQWKFCKIDVKNAFLNGKLFEEVYIRQPLRFEKYARELLERESISNAKPMATPMVCVPTLSSLTGTKLSDRTLYQQVSQDMHSPHDEHWCAIKRILRYVKGTTGFRLKFQPSAITLTGFSDADWASSLEDKKLTFGYYVYFGANLVGWSSKKQTVVSHSTTVAEYRSLANATFELAWFQSLLTEIGVMSTGVPTIWCDNVSVVSLTANPVLHARAKYIEIDLHFVHDRVLRSQLQVNFVPENDQVVDILTKPLSSRSFQSFRD
ncbi:hypothetical protein CXB51_001165 [Gossypium anomalum]|uniref:Reverse transcriptase Ty1/copia-type domain-containing protein n=1 Tax=Gossypium anomalum TaxID=47600 RepID=A0A8J6DEL4_9ROSI|nr:hypothetical protein CXB51_001165 [Gossypium anomalum]